MKTVFFFIFYVFLNKNEYFLLFKKNNEAIKNF